MDILLWIVIVLVVLWLLGFVIPGFSFGGLIHILVVEILNDRIPGFHLNSFIGYPLWSVPLVTTIVFLVSFLIVRGLQKIPFIKLIVP